MNWLNALVPAGLVSWPTALAAMTLSLALGQVIALTYIRTYRGLSYSRGMVQALVLGPIVTTMLMLAVGQSLAASIGLAGGLSIIRFRTTMRDPRDMMFVFASLGVGLVVGLRAWAVGVAGTGMFCLAAAALAMVEYGSRRQFDALLRFVTDAEGAEGASKVLALHTDRQSLITIREGGQGELLEHAYQVVLRDPEHPEALASALEAVDGVREVVVYPQDATVEP